jgi:hypothetical protein
MYPETFYDLYDYLYDLYNNLYGLYNNFIVISIVFYVCVYSYIVN